jgi:hypothetical protein
VAGRLDISSVQMQQEIEKRAHKTIYKKESRMAEETGIQPSLTTSSSPILRRPSRLFVDVRLRRPFALFLRRTIINLSSLASLLFSYLLLPFLQ